MLITHTVQDANFTQTFFVCLFAYLPMAQGKACAEKRIYIKFLAQSLLKTNPLKAT